MQVSEIDSGSEEGLKPETCSGNVQFENVAFTYPQRKEVKVLYIIKIISFSKFRLVTKVM